MTLDDLKNHTIASFDLTADAAFSASLQTVLEIVLELLWTRLPAALYAAGWSDEARSAIIHGGFNLPAIAMSNGGFNPLLEWHFFII